jgi:hypothetical protein
MSLMQRSIAARYVARPVARFVPRPTRARERSLGLHPTGTFHAAPTRATVLRRADLGPLAQLRARWRAIEPDASRGRRSGLLRPVVSIEWTRSARPRAERPSSAAPTPWHG